MTPDDRRLLAARLLFIAGLAALLFGAGLAVEQWRAGIIDEALARFDPKVQPDSPLTPWTRSPERPLSPGFLITASRLAPWRLGSVFFLLGATASAALRATAGRRNALWTARRLQALGLTVFLLGAALTWLLLKLETPHSVPGWFDLKTHLALLGTVATTFEWGTVPLCGGMALRAWARTQASRRQASEISPTHPLYKRRPMRLRPLLLGLLGSAAFAAPTLEGGPEYSTARLGAGVGDFGSRYAIKAEVDGPRADRLAAFALYDARPGALRDDPVPGSRGLAGFSLTFTQGSTARLTGTRRIQFQPWGWQETTEDAELKATAKVFTLAQDTFAVVVDLTGVTSPLTVEARIDGKTQGQGAYSAAGSSSLLTIDNLEDRPFGVALWTADPVLERTGFNGSTFGAILKSTAAVSGQLVYLLAFDDVPAAAAERPVTLAAAKGDPANWAETIRADWEAHLASYTPALEQDARRLEVDRRARTLLRMNEVGPLPSMPGPAAYPAKTHYNHFWLWDSAFEALGVSEQSAIRAFDYLDAVYRGQITRADDPELGLIPNHVDEHGVPPKLGIPGALDLFSQAPALGLALREIYERSAQDDAARERLARSYDVARPYLDWWTRRRDADLDGLAEVNGGWEGGQDNGPRYTEIWGDNLFARLAVSDNDPRPKLDSVDINAWLYLYEIELSRIARILGRTDDIQLWQQRASDRAFRMDDTTNGFWNEERGGYYDFTRVGGDKARSFLKTRTYTVWSPLFAGVTRDTARVRRLVAQLTDPKQFWGAHGVPTVAFDDAAYNSQDYWRGPVWLNINYLAASALFRYGYEAKAEELRQKVLDLVVSEGQLREYYDSTSGQGLNVSAFGWSGALYLELMRHRHEAEGFVVQEGGPAKTRQGYLRRLFRLSDGKLLAEVSAEGTYEVPRTTFESATQLFADEPIAITFEDPFQRVEGRTLTVTLPELSEAKVSVTEAGGTVRTEEPRAKGTEVIRITARVGDRIEVSRFRFKGQGGCGCGTSGGLELVALSSLAVLARARRGLRRSR